MYVLQHHGIKGMKWGVRKDNKQTRTRVRSGRLETFGKDGHNILYVVGISGSGKSTLALNLAKRLDAEPIHLDHYYDGQSKPTGQFPKFLQSNGVDLQKVNVNGKLNFDESDKIFPLLKKYSKDHKLIVEGVQLLDDTIAIGLSNTLRNEPVLSINTNPKVAFNRAMERDQSKTGKYADFIKTKKLQEVFNSKVSLSVAEAYVDSLLDNVNGGD